MNSSCSRILGAMAVCLVGMLIAGPATASTAGEKTEVSSWEILIPTDAGDFDDPFLKLDAEQLYTLSQIARLLDRGVVNDDGSDEAVKLRELNEQAREILLPRRVG